MKRTGIILFTILAFLFPGNVSSQTDGAGKIPVDPSIKTGKLANGLTYFIKSNKEPEKRASFYLIQNVGALLENDNQNGLAHFLEHMAFNGTEHFPGKAIISSLEKHGVAFGYNINAYTGHDETVYNLSDVPVDSPGLLDTCLLILYDWSDYVSLTEKEIDAERGVIREEWRTRRNASFRMMEKWLPVVLKDSKYAVRDVIGDLNVIDNFSYNTLRSFYHDWYRTDLQAVAIVGDFNADEMEKKVRDLFSKLAAVENPQQRPVFDVPFHKETLYVLATDKEAPQTSITIYGKRKADNPATKDVAYLKRQFMVRLMNSMLATRISELLQKGTPPFVTGSINFGGLVREVDALTITASANNPAEEAKALTAIYTEAERAKRTGFTQGELDRAKANLLTTYENYYKQKDKISNDSYVTDIQDYFLTSEPLTSIDYDFEFLKSILPGITVDQISELYKSLYSEENRVIVIQGPEGDGITHLTEAGVNEIINKVKASQIEPYKDAALAQSLISGELPGSRIIKTTPLTQFGAVEWTLANNARVIFKKADYEKDNVILTAYSMGGTSLYNVDMLPSATMLPALIGMYGIGDFDNVTLQKMMAGKKAAVSPSVGEVTETINGTATPKDFETMLQLLYLRFEKPRFDLEAHNAIMARYAAFIKNMEKDPSKIMQDSVSLFLTNFNPRTINLTPQMLEKVDLEKIKKIYADRFNNASEFIFIIVGNVEENTVKPLVEKYIGSIKSGQRKETCVDNKIRPPKGFFRRSVSIPLTVPKSTVFISHSADMKYNPYNNLALKVMNGILDIVFTEKVREEAGGTYGVSVSLSSQKFPNQNASGLIMFDCDPLRADTLKTIIYNELDKMIKTGPSKENLDKAVSNMLKNREESKLHNNYWSNAIYSYYYTGIDVNDPKNYEMILKKLTVADIQKASKSFFGKADVADIVFKPAVIQEKK
ncbi:MAG: insulinase family protein [Bacteroidales bacterium]